VFLRHTADLPLIVYWTHNDCSKIIAYRWKHAKADLRTFTRYCNFYLPSVIRAMSQHLLLSIIRTRKNIHTTMRCLNTSTILRLMLVTHASAILFDNRDNLCDIRWSTPRAKILLVPCGHVRFCDNCAQHCLSIHKCGLCRKQENKLIW
jgi:hypothetical protein